MSVTDVSVSVDTHMMTKKYIWEHACSCVYRLTINLNMWHCNLLQLPAQTALTAHHFHILSGFFFFHYIFSLPLLFFASLAGVYTLPLTRMLFP